MLSLGSDGKYQSETGWQDIGSNGGGGGGVNPFDARPRWQTISTGRTGLRTG